MTNSIGTSLVILKKKINKEGEEEGKKKEKKEKERAC